MTETELIISPIHWEDIREFKMREANFNKFGEVRLYNEEKYRALMSKGTRKHNTIKDIMKFSPFAIIWGNIKRKDREKLVHELDKRTVEWAYKLGDDLEDGRKEQKQFREINKKYMWKSYGISLTLTIVSAFIFNLIDDRDMSLLIVYFISFPFAKIVYDLLLGFKFSYKANKQEIFPINFCNYIISLPF